MIQILSSHPSFYVFNFVQADDSLSCIYLLFISTYPEVRLYASEVFYDPTTLIVETKMQQLLLDESMKLGQHQYKLWIFKSEDGWTLQIFSFEIFVLQNCQNSCESNVQIPGCKNLHAKFYRQFAGKRARITRINLRA